MTSDFKKTKKNVKARNKNPFDNKVPLMKNLILSPSVVDFIVISPSNKQNRCYEEQRAVVFYPFGHPMPHAYAYLFPIPCHPGTL